MEPTHSDDEREPWEPTTSDASAAAGEREPWEPDEFGQPPRRGVPVWIWGCGGGCLVALALFIGFTIWVMNGLMENFGEEHAWPVVQEVLPYGDEQPIGYAASIIDLESVKESWFMRKLLNATDAPDQLETELFGTQVIMLQESFDGTKATGSGSMAVLWRLPPGRSPEEAEPPFGFQTPGDVERPDEERMSITLQGRELEAVFYESETQESPLSPRGEQEVLRVDISGERERALVLKLISTGNVHADEAELQRFFEPFDVWRGQ